MKAAKHRRFCVTTSLALGLAFTISAWRPADAEPATKPVTGSWRPKAGLYASPGSRFEEDCGEANNLIVDIEANSISGYEYGCGIDRVADTAPGAIKLNMTCIDSNMPEPNAEGQEFKEVMLLKRIGATSMSVRRTFAGKFKGPSFRADYCPEAAQQVYAEFQKVAKESARYKVPEQLTNPAVWRPRDGVYASPGTTFNEACAGPNRVVVGLTDGSIAVDKTQCKAMAMVITGKDAMSMSMACGSSATEPAEKKSTKDSKDPKTPDQETFRISKIDDGSFFLQKSQNNEFKDAGGPVTYCPEPAQRNYSAQKAKP